MLIKILIDLDTYGILFIIEQIQKFISGMNRLKELDWKTYKFQMIVSLKRQHKASGDHPIMNVRCRKLKFVFLI